MGFLTIIAERKGKSSSGKMKSLVALTLLQAVATGDMMLKKKIHHDMMLMNSQAMCWGQGNMMYYKIPIMKVFGRHMVFFKCTKKVEAHCCGMACANHMLETMYGPSDNFDWNQYGMSNNKYERAAMTMKVMYSTASPEEAFVHNFFY